jgi:thiol:disulfide interchange protein DsbA
MFTRALAVFAAAVFSLSALAAPDEAFEGHEYTRVKNAQPVATGKKIEVLEFFWYRCPHCFQLEPDLAEDAAQGRPGSPRAGSVPRRLDARRQALLHA